MQLARTIFALATAAIASSAMGAQYPYDPAPVLVLNPKHAVAGNYKLELAHSSVTAKLSHMGLSFYTIRFNTIRGDYVYDPLHPTASKIEVVIDPASIDTGNAAFNAKIAKDYFETSRFPAINFTSEGIQAAGNHGTVTGVLDMHGVKKPIALRVVYHGSYNAEKPERMGFSATATLKRSDFGMDPNVPAEGDDMTVLIEAEFRRT